MRPFFCVPLFALVALQGAAQWSTIQMPMAYDQVSGAANFSRVYVTGGYDPNDNPNYIILEYDRITGTWDDDPSLFLNTGRMKVATAISGDRLFCAGGWVYPTQQHVGAVEIYDLASGTLLVQEHLSQPRVEIAPAVVGGKVLFAGGHQAYWNGTTYICTASNVVDVHDVGTQTWSTATLSEARAGMASAVLGGKAYFAGGYKGTGHGMSDRVDIYDAATGTWSTATLSQARAFYGGGVTVGGKVMFAGGITENETCSSRVDIHDPVTDTWTTAELSTPREGVQAATVGNYAIFAGGGCGVADWYYTSASDVVDVYDAASDAWSTAAMSNERINFLAAASGNQVFLIGGYDYTNGQFPLTVDVFTDASTIGIDERAPAPLLNVWPNPFVDVLRFGSLDALAGCMAEVRDATGRLVTSRSLRNTLELDLAFLAPGPYGISLRSVGEGRLLGRAVVVKK